MRFLNLSIHDLTPSTFQMVREIVSILEDSGVEKISFLVIPNYHNLENLNQMEEEIRNLVQGNEVILHGYTHLGKRFPFYSYKNLFTNYEGEFVSFGDTKERVERGIDILRSVGLEAHGFIPPAWLMRKKDFNILKDFGFRFTTDRLYIYDLKENRRYLSPVLTFSCRTLMDQLSILTFRLSSKVISNLKVVRLAIHPGDLLYPEKVKLISTFLKKNRELRLSSFQEILNELKLI